MVKKRLFKFLIWVLSSIAALVVTINVLLWVYRDDILGMAVDQANKYLKVKVEVAEIDLTFWGSFPNLSVDFNNVFIQDGFEGSTKYDTLLYTERLRCRFNPVDLWNEDYKVKVIELGKGTLQLKVDSSGLNNYDIFKEDTTGSEDPIDFELERLFTSQLRLSYSNAATAQNYSIYIDQLGATGDFTERTFTAKTLGDFTINEARTGEVAIVKNQPASINLGITVDLDSSRISIPNSTIYISELPFNFSGEFNSANYQFHLDGKELKLDDVANKLAPDRTRELRNYSGKGTVDFKLDVVGDQDPTKGPEINCNFGVARGSLKEPNSGINLNDLEVKGMFRRGTNPGTETLNLEKFRFRTAMGEFKGTLGITNFLKPRYDANANGILDLRILNEFLGLAIIDELKGKADLNTRFILEQSTDRNGNSRFDVLKAEGEVELTGVALKFHDDKRDFRNLSGGIFFRNDQIGVRKLALQLLDSDLEISGLLSDINRFVNGTGPVRTDVSVSSKRINVADLSSSDKVDKIQGDRQFILPNTMTGNVIVSIGDLVYEGHHFKNCQSEVILGERKIVLDKFHCSNAGAKIAGTVSVFESRPEILQLNCNLVSNDIAFNQLFKEWNNFDQEVITNENISGNAKINLSLYAPFDYRNGVISNAIEASAAVRITDGRLKNVSAFEEIIKSIQGSTAAKLAIGSDNIKTFSNKLKDLQFKTLENTITIRNSIISIPTMSVQSSALDVEISGKHHFNNDIDYRFGFRFRDLKAKKSSEFGEIMDDGTGKFIFLRMYGNMDAPIIEWDKETNREKRQEKKEEEIRDTKSMLKTEFGLFKNDTTVKIYVQEKRPKEEIKVSFDVLDSNEEVIKEKPKKDKKVNKLLDQWKKESEDAKKEDFIIGD